jgi:hypothetical protein
LLTEKVTPGHFRLKTVTSMTKKYLTRRQTYERLVEEGRFPHSWSYFQKLCAQSVGLGPPIAAWSGDTPLHTPEGSDEWAETRLSPTKPPPLGKRSVADKSSPKSAAAANEPLKRSGRPRKQAAAEPHPNPTPPSAAK